MSLLRVERLDVVTDLLHVFVEVAKYILHFLSHSFTYDHRTLRIRLPVRSAIYKQCTGGLVVRWVTTSESPLLYVFALFLPQI